MQRQTLDVMKRIHTLGISINHARWLHGSNRLQHQDQALKAGRQEANPENTTFIFFPGQGSQYVGMTQNLMKYRKVQDMFRIAEEVLGYFFVESTFVCTIILHIIPTDMTYRSFVWKARKRS